MPVRFLTRYVHPSCHGEADLHPDTPDGLQLGHAKVVLDNSIASGSVTRDGGFVMYGLRAPCVLPDTVR